MLSFFCLSFSRDRKFESIERKFKTQNPRLSCYSEANKVYHPIQRNTTIQFKVPTNHDSIPLDSDTLDTFKKLHVTCIHVRWDQKDAKSSRLLCILRNPNDVQTPIITGNYLSEALILASKPHAGRQCLSKWPAWGLSCRVKIALTYVTKKQLVGA